MFWYGEDERLHVFEAEGSEAVRRTVLKLESPANPRACAQLADVTVAIFGRDGMAPRRLESVDCGALSARARCVERQKDNIYFQSVMRSQSIQRANCFFEPFLSRNTLARLPMLQHPLELCLRVEN